MFCACVFSLFLSIQCPVTVGSLSVANDLCNPTVTLHVPIRHYTAVSCTELNRALEFFFRVLLCETNVLVLDDLNVVAEHCNDSLIISNMFDLNWKQKTKLDQYQVCSFIFTEYGSKLKALNKKTV